MPYFVVAIADKPNQIKRVALIFNVELVRSRTGLMVEFGDP